jgi:hypothetical protein
MNATPPIGSDVAFHWAHIIVIAISTIIGVLLLYPLAMNYEPTPLNPTTKVAKSNKDGRSRTRAAVVILYTKAF